MGGGGGAGVAAAVTGHTGRGEPALCGRGGASERGKNRRTGPQPLAASPLETRPGCSAPVHPSQPAKTCRRPPAIRPTGLTERLGSSTSESAGASAAHSSPARAPGLPCFTGDASESTRITVAQSSQSASPRIRVSRFCRWARLGKGSSPARAAPQKNLLPCRGLLQPHGPALRCECALAPRARLRAIIAGSDGSRRKLRSIMLSESSHLRQRAGPCWHALSGAYPALPARKRSAAAAGFGAPYSESLRRRPIRFWTRSERRTAGRAVPACLNKSLNC